MIYIRFGVRGGGSEEKIWPPRQKIRGNSIRRPASWFHKAPQNRVVVREAEVYINIRMF